MDCTIDVMVEPVSATWAQKCEFEYVGEIAIEPPARRADKQNVVELMWWSGRFTRNLSSGPMRSHSRMLSALIIRFSRDSFAPLGYAVVPDVKRISASCEMSGLHAVFAPVFFGKSTNSTIFTSCRSVLSESLSILFCAISNFASLNLTLY